MVRRQLGRLGASEGRREGEDEHEEAQLPALQGELVHRFGDLDRVLAREAGAAVVRSVARHGFGQPELADVAL